ncbi:MAG: hypothetical protein ACI8PZ_007199 [Myxococcota bacterium]|jgi:hypothetical protein
MTPLALLLATFALAADTTTATELVPVCDPQPSTLVDDEPCAPKSSDGRRWKVKAEPRLYDDGIEGDIQDPWPVLVTELDADTVVVAERDPTDDTWWTVPPLAFPASASAQFELADVDADGALDLVLADPLAGKSGVCAVWLDVLKASPDAADVVAEGAASFKLALEEDGSTLDLYDAAGDFVGSTSW